MHKLIAILLIALLASTLSSGMLTAQEDEPTDTLTSEEEVEVEEEDDAEEMEMRKYLVHVRYTTAGVQGLLAEGATSRRQEADMLFGALGGSVESMYFVVAEPEAYSIVNVPDDITATALALLVAASGAADFDITPLMTVEQVDEATQMTLEYRPPGQ